VFIVLNFLHSRLLNANPPAMQTPVIAKTETPGKKTDTATLPAKPANGNNGSWWRRSFGVSEKPPEPVQPRPADPMPQPPRPETSPPPPSPPQNPVAVDLMKQTQGAVVILLQQTDVAKNSVEMMLQQGSRTWKPSRASKYQDATFAYQKGLNYFYQKEMQAGTYDVMVRIRKGSKSTGMQAFSLFGKAVPEGRRTQTYAFGRYGIGGSQSDWQAAGQLVVTGTGLEFRPRLQKVPENLSPAPDNPPVADPSGSPAAPAPASSPSTPKKRSGKWG
jgi:hypothetical protein